MLLEIGATPPTGCAPIAYVNGVAIYWYGATWINYYTVVIVTHK
jgi:hypothetical protein